MLQNFVYNIITLFTFLFPALRAERGTACTEWFVAVLQNFLIHFICLIQQQSGMLSVGFCTSPKEFPGIALAGTPTGSDWSQLMSWQWQGWEQRDQVPVLGLQHQPLETFPGSSSVSTPQHPRGCFADQVKLSCEGLSLSVLRGSLESWCWF